MDEFFFQIPVGNGLDQFNAENVFGSDAIDFAQLQRGGLKHPLQRLKSLQGLFSRTFAIFARHGQREQKFDDFIVVKTIKTARQESLTQSLSVALAFMRFFISILGHRTAFGLSYFGIKSLVFGFRFRVSGVRIGGLWSSVF